MKTNITFEGYYSMKKILLFFGFSIFAIGLFADAKGDGIAKKTFDLPKPNDTYQVIKMILIDSNNNRKERKLTMYSKKTYKGTNSFIEFHEPADVKGSRFLTIGYDEGDDDQRLYLPALGKVRKISSSSKGGSFMGSGLNYYDMEVRSYSDSTYKHIGEDTYNRNECFMLESYPKDPDSPYSKTVSLVDKQTFVSRKIDCYDKNNRLEKIINMVEIKQIKGYFINLKITVDNKLQNSKTLLVFQNMQINTGLRDDIFTIQNLSH